MARLVLITGGCRSGKSGFAHDRALAGPGPHTFVATAMRGMDPEFDRRIDRHVDDRDPAWALVEAPLHLDEALAGCAAGTVLVDCLTLWLGNHQYRGGEAFGEDDATRLAVELVEAIRAREGTVFCVTNEVGWGVVPATAAGRAFRDQAGRVNRTLADAADTVVLMVSGQPLTVKGEACP